MDEPTNHLDIPTINGLAHALKRFEGSILIISHDQHFVETCCSEFWCVGNRKIKIFNDFKKCISYSKKCKAPNNLPREYDGEEKKESQTKAIKKETKKVNKVFVIDVEREIEKGLNKGLTPNGILRHCKGWKAVDGKKMVVTKLGFTMFAKYFDGAENEHFAFFEEWKDLIIYCIPQHHDTNQYELFNIAVTSFITAFKDKQANAIKSYGFGLILEAMVVQYKMFNLQIIENWLMKNKDDERKSVVVTQIQTFMEIVNGDDDSDSDSDFD
eukprot:UN02428